MKVALSPTVVVPEGGRVVGESVVAASMIR